MEWLYIRVRTNTVCALPLFAVSLLLPSLVCLAQQDSPQEAPQKQEEAAPAAKSPPGNAFKWASNITNLNLGEWFPLSFSHDGEVVKYATLKDTQRQGHIATVWFRNEFRDRQQRAGVMPYRSGSSACTVPVRR
jgi:hypothetical protein